ncbi:putative lipoprotein [Myxococcus hansupus]|uniref:Putative lipoprotein n=1 Tax=Pseudomyxococcus hansupus TaxID=1297742 RepID=A0A0H4XMI6_9BACT|nr:putative lipoprotein [Myxococcus hansupus]
MLSVYLAGALCACAMSPARVPPVAPEGATSVGPFVPEARDLFEGCVPVPDSERSRLYRCEGLTVWLAERDGMTLEQALAEAQVRVTQRLGAGVTSVEDALPLAGRPWPAVRFEACAAGDCRAGGYVSAVTGELDRVRQLGCVARANARPLLARCVELLEYLASNGTPEGEPLGADALLVPPRLPWRPLAVPDGCQLSVSTARSGRLRCEDASFLWSLYTPARPAVTARWRSRSVEALWESLPGAGAVEEVSCQLENLDTRCSRFTVPAPEGALVVWAAAVEWEDRALFAACSHRASEAPFPAVCNGAFTLP